MRDEDYNIKADEDYTGAISSNDCTGLIPSGTAGEKELQKYQDLYPFGAPTMNADNNLFAQESSVQEDNCPTGTGRSYADPSQAGGTRQDERRN